TAQPASRGLDAKRLASTAPPASVESLSQAIARDGGSVLATYRDPLGGHWQLLAALPIDRVEPTPFQRDLSEAHVGRVANAIDKLDRYLDPVIVVPAGDGLYWSPNGYHRLGAMRELGARSIVALVIPEPEVAHHILLLNTEKAHNLRERALEVVRLAEALAVMDERPEREFETEFEEAALVTLGFCYQQNGRFSGGAYHPVLKRCDRFLNRSLPDALMERRLRADKLIELNELVNQAVAAMKSRGMESPYLKAFVVARINPLRFQRKPTADFDETIDKMLGSARRFDAQKIRSDQIARSGGAPSEE
ncbi:MAG: chromosome partitioning protein ParB, partial [Thermoanaerobaculia bacterium]